MIVMKKGELPARSRKQNALTNITTCIKHGARPPISAQQPCKVRTIQPNEILAGAAFEENPVVKSMCLNEHKSLEENGVLNYKHTCAMMFVALQITIF